MNSTLKPHLLIETFGLHEIPMPTDKLCSLFLRYRGFPEAFALAFRYRCEIRYEKLVRFWLPDSFFSPEFVVTTRDGMKFRFHKLLHIPTLLRIAGRLVTNLGSAWPNESWIEPFLEGIDENQHLERIACKVDATFLNRYLRHHDSLPTVEFAVAFDKFSFLDQLENPKIDTLEIKRMSPDSNTKSCHIKHIIVGQRKCIPFHRTTIPKHDKDYLNFLSIVKDVRLDNALEFITNRFSYVKKLQFSNVRIDVSDAPLLGMIECYKSAVEKLWNVMRSHSGEVTVSVVFERQWDEPLPVIVECCKNALPGYTVAMQVKSVECHHQRKADKKDLQMRVAFYNNGFFKKCDFLALKNERTWNKLR